MKDLTEEPRRKMVAKINSDPAEREELEKRHGQVWDTQEVQNDFNVIGFMAPFAVVQRKADGKEGMLTFQHYPRFYFSFEG